MVCRIQGTQQQVLRLAPGLSGEFFFPPYLQSAPATHPVGIIVQWSYNVTAFDGFNHLHHFVIQPGLSFLVPQICMLCRMLNVVRMCYAE